MALAANQFVDLQVNGYRGVDFNADGLQAEDLHAACMHLREDGTMGILATIITDRVDRMTARLARLAALRQVDPLVQEVVWGVHIEGPFLNASPGYVGAHPAEFVSVAEVATIRRLLDAADGLTRIVTLAPERDPGLRVTRFLADQGICVSAGHCDPSRDELRAAIDAGLTMFTHLGNGCPMLLPRHDNIIQRVLELSDQLTICLIGDGIHIPYFALKNYLRLTGCQRSIIVTDAIAAAGLGPGRYKLAGQEVQVDEELAAWAPDHSHLVGSTATMPRMVAQMRKELGLGQAEIERLVIENPRRVLLGE